MIHARSPYDPDDPVVVIDIGNTSVSVATWQSNAVKTPIAFPRGDSDAFLDAFSAHAGACPRGRPSATVISSVVPETLDRIRDQISRIVSKPALVVGDELALPLDVGVDNPRGVGVDRVCAAAAAFDRLQRACIVVDFGTAVTVDLVDDDGVFVGGAILPGLRLQLQALHERTAVLPAVEPAVPDAPYGRNTIEAIQTGVCRGLAGAVRGIVEGYATALNRWPQVVATGGDLEFMAPLCDFLDTAVKHLTLRGVGLAYHKYMVEAGA